MKYENELVLKNPKPQDKKKFFRELIISNYTLVVSQEGAFKVITSYFFNVAALCLYHCF